MLYLQTLVRVEAMVQQRQMVPTLVRIMTDK